jgi:hypothetical protein
VLILLFLDYARAAEVLQPVSYPEHYPALKKLKLLEKQAEALGHGDNFYRVPQTTFFHDGLNSVGVEMKASTGSGQDCTGVNDGSKISVLMNYLPDAWNRGAEIFCECEVRYVLKNSGESGGYIVFFAWHGAARHAFSNSFSNELMWVRAVRYSISFRYSRFSSDAEGALFPRCGRSRHERNPAPVQGARP